MLVHKSINFTELEKFDEFIEKVKKLKNQKRTFTISANFDIKNNNSHMCINWQDEEDI